MSSDTRRWVPGLIAGTILLAACAPDAGVSRLSARASESTTPTAPVATDPATGSTGTAPTVPDDTAAPTPTTGAPTTTAPPEPTLPPIIEPAINVDIPLESVVIFDPDKPVRSYDRFLGAALTDIDQWWERTYPEVYGSPFEPLAGGIYAGYPERESDLPGCGQPRTEYRELAQFVAFYCEVGDVIVYDDDNDDILAPLAEEFGPAVMGVVLAHEYGHAIQGRIGALARPLATIITEQQADCFAGAWTGQAYRGESALLRLGDADVRAGLIAMLSVRDPVGTSQFVPGGHGSAFDRVGAFQEGFLEGPARCAELIDAPLDLVPNAFRFQSDVVRGGDASYDCSDDPNPECTPATLFLADDLNDFWRTALGPDFADLAVLPTADLPNFACADAIALAAEVVLCESLGIVAFDEPAVVSLYREFGDFTLGYFYGIAWAEAAQRQVASALDGEDRALLNDCFTGAWVRDITPDENGATPRQRDTDGDGIPEGIRSSPGDLDEAIRMAILEGDDGANVDIVGTAFEKIAALRVGALGGLAACETQLG